MRAFIVLCLVAVASADIGLQLAGYNYGAGSHGSDHGGLGAGSSPAGSVSGGFGNLGQGIAGQGSSGHGSSGLGGLGGNSGLGFNGGDSGFTNVAEPSNEAPSFAGDAGFEKEFFTYTADEEDFAQPEASEQISNNLKQGLRVVFIKGPENKGLEDAALALAKSASEQKTAIYVLNKQTDIGDLANKLNSVSNNNAHKPEVHFVKYRTPEDAANAQQQIQNQYDSLGGGPAKTIDGGVAPAINFASQAPARHADHAGHGSHGSNGHHAGHGSHGNADHGVAESRHNDFGSQNAASSRSYIPPSGSYIPPSIFRRFRL